MFKRLLIALACSVMVALPAAALPPQQVCKAVNLAWAKTPTLPGTWTVANTGSGWNGTGSVGFTYDCSNGQVNDCAVCVQTSLYYYSNVPPVPGWIWLGSSSTQGRFDSCNSIGNAYTANVSANNLSSGTWYYVEVEVGPLQGNPPDDCSSVIYSISTTSGQFLVP